MEGKPRNIFRLKRKYTVNIAELRQKQWQLNYDIYHANDENNGESVAKNSHSNSNIPNNPKSSLPQTPNPTAIMIHQ